MRRIAPAVALYFLAPFVAEFLLGDFPITMILLILPLSTMYGGGALLIRELVRRTGRGWPTIILLALAFGVVEEGLLTQSLFNPDYLNAHLLDEGFVPALGISVPWTIFVLTIHTIWSISTPIAVVEEATRSRRTQPWLGIPGFIAAATLFAVGSAFTFGVSYSEGKFMASWSQLLSAAVVAVALVVVAFRLAGRTREEGGVPRGRSVFAGAMVAGLALFSTEILPTVADVIVVLAVLAAITVIVARWSRRSGWGPWQRFALAGAALLTYAWHSFLQHPVEGDSPGLNLVTHLTFTVVTLLIIWSAQRRIRHTEPAPVATEPAPVP